MPYADRKEQNKDCIFLFSDGFQYQWEDEWNEMPAFLQKNKNPYKSIIVHFDNEKDFNEFEKLINQKIENRKKTRPFIWFPEKTKIEKQVGVWK